MSAQRKRPAARRGSRILRFIPMSMSMPALVILAILAVLLAALAAFETVRSREFREKLRAH